MAGRFLVEKKLPASDIWTSKNGGSQIPNFAREVREFLIWWRHHKKSRARFLISMMTSPKNSENGDVITKNSENGDVMTKNSENDDVIARKWSFLVIGAEGAEKFFRADC